MGSSLQNDFIELRSKTVSTQLTTSKAMVELPLLMAFLVLGPPIFPKISFIYS